MRYRAEVAVTDKLVDVELLVHDDRVIARVGTTGFEGCGYVVQVGREGVHIVSGDPQNVHASLWATRLGREHIYMLFQIDVLLMISVSPTDLQDLDMLRTLEQELATLLGQLEGRPAPRVQRLPGWTLPTNH